MLSQNHLLLFSWLLLLSKILAPSLFFCSLDFAIFSLFKAMLLFFTDLSLIRKKRSKVLDRVDILHHSWNKGIHSSFLQPFFWISPWRKSVVKHYWRFTRLHVPRCSGTLGGLKVFISQIIALLHERDFFDLKLWRRASLLLWITGSLSVAFIFGIDLMMERS